MKKISSFGLLLLVQLFIHAQKPRARDIGIPFDGTTGKFNAITDVKGIEVGYSIRPGKKHSRKRPCQNRCYRYFTKRENEQSCIR